MNVSAPVRIEARAWGDIRFATLARLLGLADSDHALIKVARLWSWQTEHFAAGHPTYIVDADTIESVLGAGGPAALVRAKLATEVPGGYRLHGTEGQIEWCEDLSSKRQHAGRARADGALRDARGRLLPKNGEVGNTPPAHAGDHRQHATSTPPAQSSAPAPDPTPEDQRIPPARDPAVPSPAPERQPVGQARTLLAELETARSEAAGELGVEIQPLAFGDPGERDLAERIAAARSQSPAAVDLVVRQTRHAIAMAKLETVRGEKPFEWFTGAVFAERNFRRLVGKTAETTIRAGPRRGLPPEPIRKIKTL